VGDEVEEVRCDDIDGVLVDDREERLQVMPDRPQRVRPRPASNERQIGIDELVAERVAGLPARGRGSEPAVEVRIRHGNWFIPACSSPQLKHTGIPEGSSVY